MSFEKGEQITDEGYYECEIHSSKTIEFAQCNECGENEFNVKLKYLGNDVHQCVECEIKQEIAQDEFNEMLFEMSRNNNAI